MIGRGQQERMSQEEQKRLLKRSGRETHRRGRCVDTPGGQRRGGFSQPASEVVWQGLRAIRQVSETKRRTMEFDREDQQLGDHLLGGPRQTFSGNLEPSPTP